MNWIQITGIIYGVIIYRFFMPQVQTRHRKGWEFSPSPRKKEYDRSPTAVLNEIGITVLRFWNEQVIRDPEHVLRRITEYLR